MRFLKFCCVGLSGVALNLLVFNLLVHFGFHYLLAAVGAFFVAVTNNFLWNSLWTFKDRLATKKVKDYKRYIKFVIISAICLAGNLLILAFLVEKLHFVQWQAQIIAVGCMSVLNFLLQNLITFEAKNNDKVVSTL